MTPAQRHMGRIAAMPCIFCRLLGTGQAEETAVHHIRANREARNDFLTLPVCWTHHQSEAGIHGDQRYLRMLKVSEWGLLAEVIRDLGVAA